MTIAARNGARQTRAAWLRRIRFDRELTQAQLGHKVGVTANAISRYERGLDSPTLETFDRILKELECWYADLLPTIDDPVPPRRKISRPFQPLASTIQAVIDEFALPTRSPENYPARMRCWICHGRPGECACYYICQVCKLPVIHGRKCSGMLH